MFKALKSWIVRTAVSVVDSTDFLAEPVSRLFIKKAASVARTRPHPWSTVHD